MARFGCRGPAPAIAAGLVALLAVALPVGLDPAGSGLVAKGALAKKDGDDGGNGGGNAGGNGGGNGGGHGGQGGGPGKADRDNTGGRGSKSSETSRPSPDGRQPHGHAFGLGRVIERLTGQDRGSARSRYEQALGRHGAIGRGAGTVDPEVIVELTPEQTALMIRTGWGRHQRLDDGWRNHGERVRTMVEIAKALGYPASVGALQGNFGTPFENGLEPLPAGEWTVIDLDVNHDGTVDLRDLAALDAPEPQPVTPVPNGHEGDGSGSTSSTGVERSP